MGRHKLVVAPDDPLTLKAAELYRNGASLLAAAEKVYMSAPSLKKRFDALGIQTRNPHRKPLSPEQVEKIRQERRCGKLQRQIARKYGVSCTTIRNYTKDIKLDRETIVNGKRIPQKIAEAIRREYIPHKIGYLKLSQKYGVSTTTVANYVKRR